MKNQQSDTSSYFIGLSFTNNYFFSSTEILSAKWRKPGKCVKQQRSILIEFPYAEMSVWKAGWLQLHLRHSRLLTDPWLVGSAVLRPQHFGKSLYPLPGVLSPHGPSFYLVALSHQGDPSLHCFLGRALLPLLGRSLVSFGFVVCITVGGYILGDYLIHTCLFTNLCKMRAGIMDVLVTTVPQVPHADPSLNKYIPPFCTHVSSANHLLEPG